PGSGWVPRSLWVSLRSSFAMRATEDNLRVGLPTVARLPSPNPARYGGRRLVGATGFEPATFRSQSGRSTRLSHAPDRCYCIALLAVAAQEQLVGGIALFFLVRIAQRAEETLECGAVFGRDFESSQHAPEVGAVVAIVKQADVPAPAEAIEKVHQRAGAFGKLESIQPFIL